VGLASSLLLASCDLGPAEERDSERPPLHLIASYPPPYAGLDCAPAELDRCGVPVNTQVELRFDRFLLPSTAVRQSILVAAGPNFRVLRPRYDVLERVVVFSLPPGETLLAGTRYDVELLQPEVNSDGWGFRAFDGAPLSAEGSAPLRFSFRTTRASPAPPPEPDPVPFAAVSEVFVRAGCASAGCHVSASGAVPPLGLDLSSAFGVQRTAIGKVARQTEIGPRSGQSYTDPARFGLGQPRIDPGRPESSYLLYKLLVSPELCAEERCETAYAVGPQRGSIAPPRAERERLISYFIEGHAMPLPVADAPRPHVNAVALADLRLLERWIAEGARLD
jgi:hypothetical protein